MALGLILGSGYQCAVSHVILVSGKVSFRFSCFLPPPKNMLFAGDSKLSLGETT